MTVDRQGRNNKKSKIGGEKKREKVMRNKQIEIHEVANKNVTEKDKVTVPTSLQTLFYFFNLHPSVKLSFVHSENYRSTLTSHDLLTG